MGDRMFTPRSEGEHWFGERVVFVRYLITRLEHNRLGVLTVSASGGMEALPVFSTKLAALAFLRVRDCETGWEVRESTAGELISLLMGHVADVEYVTLDPPPDTGITAEPSVEIVGKSNFINRLMQEPLARAAHRQPVG